MSNSPFLNSIRTDMRQKGYALKTEKTYLHWIKRFILFHKKRHPQTPSLSFNNLYNQKSSPLQAP
ncbi:hypothetical protein AKN91_01535 [Thiopseudomonas alkaliphila]|nr:hypothetical protein AKN91_01535 [Thiopseudomonas alkaliphila]